MRTYDDNLNNWKPGDYGKTKMDIWHARIPTKSGDPLVFANLQAHEVIEHEDGTITVSPSIKVTIPNSPIIWHGYLKKGVWERLPDSNIG